MARVGFFGCACGGRASFLAIAVTLSAATLAGVTRGQEAPPPTAADGPDASAVVPTPSLPPVAEPAQTSDPALDYVPAGAEAVLTVDVSVLADRRDLAPLYELLLSGIVATAPVPADRLEDLRSFTAFAASDPEDATRDPYGLAGGTIAMSPGEFAAIDPSSSTRSMGMGFVLRFEKPIYDRDVRRALPAGAERVGPSLIPTYRLSGRTVYLLENRYLVLLPGELPASTIPFLDPDAFARTPTGERLEALGRDGTLRAVVAGEALRMVGEALEKSEDAALFREFWGRRVDAWTLRFDAVPGIDDGYLVRAMMQTVDEPSAAELEEELVGGLRLALAAARDWQASQEPVSPVVDADRAPTEMAPSTDGAFFALLEDAVRERRIAVGHVDAAAGIRLAMMPREILGLPAMLQSVLGGGASQAGWMEQDRARQRRILAALLAYHVANGHYPPPVIHDKDSGEPRSWRVELLPYLGEESLFALYRKSEPWDGDANQKLIQRIPDVYRSSFDGSTPPGLAVAALVHPQGVFSPERKSTAAEIVDGPANVVAIATVVLPFPWTRPQDIDAFGTEELSDLAWSDAGVLGGFVDGRSHLLTAVPGGTLRTLVARDDGGVLPTTGVELDPLPGLPAPPAPPPTVPPEALPGEVVPVPLPLPLPLPSTEPCPECPILDSRPTFPSLEPFGQ